MPIPQNMLSVARPKNTIVIAYGKDKNLYAVSASAVGTITDVIFRSMARQSGTSSMAYMSPLILPLRQSSRHRPLT